MATRRRGNYTSSYKLQPLNESQHFLRISWIMASRVIDLQIRFSDLSGIDSPLINLSVNLIPVFLITTHLISDVTVSRHFYVAINRFHPLQLVDLTHLFHESFPPQILPPMQL